jgi:hypothetical protein
MPVRQWRLLLDTVVLCIVGALSAHVLVLQLGDERAPSRSLHARI